MVEQHRDAGGNAVPPDFEQVFLPHLDAALTSYSLVASWWQARKHIANWWLWIAVDLIYIGEYLYKNLVPTALLYAGLVALAALGLRDWRRAAQTPHRAASQIAG